MSLNVWTPMLTSNHSLRNKSMRARKKVARVELLRGLCCDMLWPWPAETDNAGYKKIFCPPKKGAKLKTIKYNNGLRKVVISNLISDALRNSHTTKYKIPHNIPDDGCLWKPATANNVRMNKKLWFVAFRKLLLYFIVLSFAPFSWGQTIFTVSCVIGFYASQSQHIVAHASQKFYTCDFVASSPVFVAKAVIACEHWCPYIVRHRAPLCILLTHVWKPPLTWLQCVLEINW